MNDNYLKDEYFKLQDQYENYDARALQIKGWIAGGSIAGLALGISSDPDSMRLILLVVISISLCFWYLESKWKMFQYAMSDRIRVIEAHFRNDNEILIKDPAPLQIYNWWFKSYVKDEPIYKHETNRPQSKMARLWRAARQTFVHLPYSLIIALCVLIYTYKI